MGHHIVAYESHINIKKHVIKVVPPPADILKITRVNTGRYAIPFSYLQYV